MADNPDISVEISSQSLPGRNADLIMKFINHDDKDYYYPVHSIAGPNRGGFSVNNTVFTKKYNVPWQRCTTVSDSTGDIVFYPGLEKLLNIEYTHIPVNGEYEVRCNIVSLCPFLQYMSTEDNEDGYWIRYQHGGFIELMTEPSDNWTKFAGSINLPIIEVHFDLID